jgi:RNA polymerase sigma-70 factor (sigma-E family)
MTRQVRGAGAWVPEPRTAGPGDGSDAELTRDVAIEVLFRRHYRELIRLAYCLLGEQPQAEDAVQDAFMSLYRHWHQLRDRQAAPDYLRSAVINRSRSQVRSFARERRRNPSELVDVPGSSAEDDAVPRADAARLDELVRGLPRRQREVIVCRYFLDLSVAETAELLGVGVGSVKRYAHRALQALTKSVEVGA